MGMNENDVIWTFGGMERNVAIWVFPIPAPFADNVFWPISKMDTIELIKQKFDFFR
jgi:hypothetical protein